MGSSGLGAAAPHGRGAAPGGRISNTALSGMRLALPAAQCVPGPEQGQGEDGAGPGSAQCRAAGAEQEQGKGRAEPGAFAIPAPGAREVGKDPTDGDSSTVAPAAAAQG